MNLCKNCSSELNGKFCSNCGQPATLKRIDAHYIKHEIEHVLHLEKGIFYTIKELVIRPGKSVRQFISEDRNRLVKPIIFIIVASLIYSLVNNFYHIEEQYIQYKDGGIQNSTVGKMFKWVQDHYGYSNILMSVFIAFFLKLFFRKYPYNFYEIVVLLCYLMGVGMLIYALFALIEGLTHSNLFAIGGMLGLAYTIWGIADFFNRKKISSYLKAISAYLLGSLILMVLVIFIGVLIDKLILN